MDDPQQGKHQNPNSRLIPDEFAQQCYDVRIRWINGELSFKEAISLLNAYKQAAITDTNLAHQAMANYQLGYIYHYHGNLEASIHHYQQARSIFERVGDHENASRMTLNLGEEYRYKGDFDRALGLFQIAHAAAEAMGILEIQMFATLNTGYALLDLEQWERARETLHHTARLADQIDDYWQKDIILCELHCGLAIASLKLNDTQAIWANTRKALAVAQRDNQPRLRGHTNRLLGELISELKAAPDPTMSLNPDEYFQKSLAAFQEIQAMAEIARTTFAQACSLAQRGKKIAAAHKFQQAMLTFNRLGMIHDAARAAHAQLRLM